MTIQNMHLPSFDRFKRKPRRERVSKFGQVTLSLKNWRALKEDVWFRAQGRCENTLMVNGEKRRCPNPAHDPHHLLSRGRGGSDTFDNVFAACRGCHNALHDGQQDFIPWTEGEYDA